MSASRLVESHEHSRTLLQAAVCCRTKRALPSLARNGRASGSNPDLEQSGRGQPAFSSTKWTRRSLGGLLKMDTCAGVSVTVTFQV